jgi:hypothetical protein
MAEVSALVIANAPVSSDLSMMMNMHHCCCLQMKKAKEKLCLCNYCQPNLMVLLMMLLSEWEAAEAYFL